MRGIAKFFKWLLILIVATALGLYISGYGYVLKGVWVLYLHGHSGPYIDDFAFFENEVIPESSHPQPWPFHRDYNSFEATETLKRTNTDLETIAFLVIKNDSIWYEKYFEGYDKDSQTNSYSMVKSIVSSLTGAAIDDGFLENLDQRVSDFYPEFDQTGLTIGDLSSMSSGLNWEESYGNPFGKTAQSYLKKDLAGQILKLEVVDTPGISFKYLSGNTQLLAMVVQKAVQKPLAAYLYEKFWDPMGAENPALWQVDDKEHRLVKAYCCFGSNARDFARFGKLYKDYGQWNGKQLLDSAFVSKSISPRFPESPEYGYGFWLSDYRHKNIFAMRGILGQYVIVIPEDNLIIVRLGKRLGKKTNTAYMSDFFIYIDEVYKMLKE